MDPFDPEVLAYSWGADPAELLDVDEFLVQLITRPAWHRHAACQGMDAAAFFPPPRMRPTGRQVCDGCPVRAECLADAMAQDPASDYGVYGGTSRQERQALRRGRAVA